MINNAQRILLKLPKPLMKSAKALMVYPRYYDCLRRARKNFSIYGDRYKHPVLFVAGMPKSGTTWVEQMLGSCPGYQAVLIPEASFSELKTGEGHCFELPLNALSRFKNMLVLTKMHVPGTENNGHVLSESGVPCLVLHRDLRDVSISHYFYVRNTPWHGDYPALKDISVEAGVEFFIKHRLEEFIAWIDGWEKWRDPESSMCIRYEDLLSDTRGQFAAILRLFELNLEENEMDRVVDHCSFKNLKSKNATVGFFRKGVSGDWQKHYTPELRTLFKEYSGDYLLRYGYEESSEW